MHPRTQKNDLYRVIVCLLLPIWKLFLDHFSSLLLLTVFLTKDVFVLQYDFPFEVFLCFRIILWAHSYTCTAKLRLSYWLLHYRELCIQSCQLWSCSNAVADVLWLAENWSSSQTNQHKKGHSKRYQEHHHVKYDDIFNY